MRLVWLIAILILVPAGAPSADYYDGLRAFDSRNHAEAFRRWKAAADAGDARSQHRLGRLYEAGRGVPQSYVLAHLYYNLAAARGNAPARAARDRLARRMAKSELAEARRRAAAWRPAGRKPTGTRSAGAQRGGLRALFSGARAYLQRDVNRGYIMIVMDFHRDGRVSGSFTHNEGSDAGIGKRGVRGTWSVKAGKLCTVLEPFGFTANDPPGGACYTITGSNKRYSASGANGLLGGNFRLDR